MENMENMKNIENIENMENIENPYKKKISIIVNYIKNTSKINNFENIKNFSKGLELNNEILNFSNEERELVLYLCRNLSISIPNNIIYKKNEHENMTEIPKIKTKIYERICWSDNFNYSPLTQDNSVSAIAGYLKSILSLSGTDEILKSTFISKLLGYKRFGDWNQISQIKKYYKNGYFILRSDDWWCCVTAIFVGCPIIMDHTDIIGDIISDDNKDDEDVLDDSNNEDSYDEYDINNKTYIFNCNLMPDIVSIEDNIKLFSSTSQKKIDQIKSLPSKLIPVRNIFKDAGTYNIDPKEFSFLLNKYLKYKMKYLKQKGIHINKIKEIINIEKEHLNNNINYEVIKNKYLKYKNKYLQSKNNEKVNI
jgi:hypothetical protein